MQPSPPPGRPSRKMSDCLSMCGKMISRKLIAGPPLDRQRGFDRARHASARIFYAGSGPQQPPGNVSKQWRRLKAIRGNKTVPRARVERQQARDMETHRSVQALVAHTRSHRWHETKVRDQFARGVHFRPPTSVANKISVMTGSDRCQPADYAHLRREPLTDRPRDTPPLNPLPPLRSLSARRRSIDLSLLKVQMRARLVPVFQVFETSHNGSMNMHELRCATDELKLKPYGMTELRAAINLPRKDPGVIININQECFIGLIFKRLNDKIPRYQALLDNTERFKNLEKLMVEHTNQPSQPNQPEEDTWEDSAQQRSIISGMLTAARDKL